MAKLTKEQRENFKKEYGEDKLKWLEIPTDDMNTDYMEVLACIPTRAVMSQYMKYIDVNPKKAQEILIKQCVLTDKETIMVDDALFMTAVSMLAELIPIREGRIKKF
ncbi:hypothetical protein [Aquimarina algiphila]|uniref:Uncharacterized protein n=1 Tax=Aquimarina algiphila TaxID=2047982 RepID=A0A554VF00_9FLAO|nr:hypothetical protein [Aquimarina algiphila]TSE05670.1 hypothetical protein FOF46_21825 [Aquimarina algiphila]